MPNYIQLYPIGSNKPATFQSIDENMRLHFNEPQDPDNWFCGWYNYIAFLLALGKTWQEIRQDLDEQCLTNPIESDQFKWASITRDILDWLQANYTENCWAEIGRQ